MSNYIYSNPSTQNEIQNPSTHGECQIIFIQIEAHIVIVKLILFKSKHI